MYGASSRFFQEIRKSHTSFAYVDCTSATNETVRLVALGGQVDVDRSASVRRRLSVTCMDPTGELTPERAGDLLTPYGTTLRAYRGVMYSDGTIEVCPLGVFRISTVTVIDDSGTATNGSAAGVAGGSASIRHVGGISGGLSLQLDAYDLSRTVSRDKFTVPYTIAQGTNVVTAIRDIMGRTFDDLTYDTMSTSLTVSPGQTFDAGEDPWEVAQGLASSLGADVYFDVVGNLVVSPTPDIQSLTESDFDYVEGENCTMLAAQRVFTDEPGFNGVVVIGESPGDELPPVTATAWDDNPVSLTYHLGPYGEVPMFIQDQVVKTEEQAQAVANAALSAILGFVSQVYIDTVVNPAYECGDIVRVKRARSKIDDYYVVDAFTVPLGAIDSQSINLRQMKRNI